MLRGSVRPRSAARRFPTSGGLVALALCTAALLTGCARQGTADGPTQSGGSAPPSVHLAACVDPSATPTAAAASPSARPTPSRPEPRVTGSQSEQDREELFRRNQAANKAFRNRHPLPPQIESANQPCVDAVRAGLVELKARGQFDPASIEQVLQASGLTGVIARRPGRLDLAGSGGLLFAGTTGQGCVFGEYGPDVTEVNFGSGIADGGCLPAPD